MQLSTSSRSFSVHDSLLPLLDAVEVMMFASIRASAEQVSRSTESASDAAAYHLKAGGQRVRTKIALQAGLDAGLDSSDAVVIAATVELLHNASLVHDDIEDGDEDRRGQPAVWCRFGVNTAICTGDLLLSASYATLCKLNDTRALAQMISLVHKRVSMAIDGQCADLRAGTAKLVDIATAVTHYQQIAIAKSGALLGLPLELVLLAAGHEAYLSDAWATAQAFAIGYQIVDDLHDVQTDSSSETAKSGYNIVTVYKGAGSPEQAVENARQLGLEKINLAISLANSLPFKIGERLADYACALRGALTSYKYEAQISGRN